MSRDRTIAERKLYELFSVVDDLTTLAQTEDGARAIVEQFRDLIETERKLHDLVLDARQPVAAE